MLQGTARRSPRARDDAHVGATSRASLDTVTAGCLGRGRCVRALAAWPGARACQQPGPANPSSMVNKGRAFSGRSLRLVSFWIASPYAGPGFRDVNARRYGGDYAHISPPLRGYYCRA